ncbi:MAG: beta-ketoacyl-ACP synthase II [Armatimonadota bacterium]|nr:beta-ketoacyl-ACP synthase II [Armatimonadota bacterium]MDR7440051.1 beta-ketoacyl-ACP synthase II [Armatimonadota bacterium]
MKGHRVAVTGIGAITPIGIGVEGLWRGVREGRSGVRRLERFDASGFASQVAGEVVDFDPAAVLEPKQVKRLDRFAQFAVACARQAVADAGLDLEAVDRDRVGVFIGTALGGAAFAEEQARIYLQEGIRRVRPTLAVSVFGGAASCNIAIDLGLTGPTSANSDSCASGAIAIGEAMRLVRGGEVDLMLAGGVEVPLTPLIFGAFDLLRAMSARFNHDPARASRPFDRHRDGFVMAEGAAILVLERLEHALARHARIYGEVVGYGATNDAHHMTAPLPTGAQAARAMRLALRDAGLAPEQIDHINAHASSTPLNDVTETRAVKEVFGPHAHRILISGTKSMHGHPLGAAGAVEAAICLLTLSRGYVPPTLNLEEPDPECDLDYVPNQGRSARVHHALNNSFGFGGINACLAFGRYPASEGESR